MTFFVVAIFLVAVGLGFLFDGILIVVSHNYFTGRQDFLGSRESETDSGKEILFCKQIFNRLVPVYVWTLCHYWRNYRDNGDLMSPEHLVELKNNKVVRKRLAKLIAAQCFRNSMLEDFHARTVPSSQSTDYSDVKVVTGYGEIPWNDLSRISDKEMKALMIDAVNRSYRFLSELFDSPYGDAVIEALKKRDPLPEWNDPAIPTPLDSPLDTSLDEPLDTVSMPIKQGVAENELVISMA